LFEGLDCSFLKNLTFRFGLKSTTYFSPDLKLLVPHHEAVHRHFGMSVNIDSASWIAITHPHLKRQGFQL